MTVKRFRSRMLISFLVVLFAGILTLWAPGLLALALFQAAVFQLGFVWLFYAALDRIRLRGSLALIPLGLATLWPLVQLAVGTTIYRQATWDSFWTWVADFVCFSLALQIAADPGQLKSFLKALLYFAFGLSVVATLQMFTSGGKIFWLFASGYTDFVLGPFVYRNQYAAFIELTLPVALYFSLVSRRNRMAYAVMGSVMAASVVASASRAGTILVFAELFAVPVLALRMGLVSWRAVRATLGKVLALTLVSVVVVGFAVVWERFLTPDPYFLRREVLVAAAHMFRDRPAMGFGLGTWTSAYPGYAIFDPGVVINQAHNDWVQWAIEGGLPFFLFLSAFAVLLQRSAVRSVWGIGTITVLMHCLIDYPLQQRPAFAGLFFAVGGAVIVGIGDNFSSYASTEPTNH
jgi:hypothetical protein